MLGEILFMPSPGAARGGGVALVVTAILGELRGGGPDRMMCCREPCGKMELWAGVSMGGLLGPWRLGIPITSSGRGGLSDSLVTGIFTLEMGGVVGDFVERGVS